MALLKFEAPKELAHLRVKIARDVHERVARYQTFCGALELGVLVERALTYVMDKDVAFRAQENGVAEAVTKSERRQRGKRVSPADKTGGVP